MGAPLTKNIQTIYITEKLYTSANGECSSNKQHKIVMEVKIQQKSALQVIFDINTFHC
jgi:hypothetical protein